MAAVHGAVRWSFLLLLLFAGSGCAALIYEVVWFHLLRLVVGGSAISLGFLLGSFMGGMCLGSLLLPRLVRPDWHPLRVYAALEVAIGGFGLLLPEVLPILGRIYVERVGHGPGGILLRGAVCAVALLLPTFCMGATLPAIARWLDTSKAGIAALGRFYGANIAGAVLGTLGAGFYLLRVHDTVVATQVAAALNGLVALVALGLSCCARVTPPVASADSGPAAPRRPAVYVAIALSGLCALAAEVVWTRHLALLFGASVYTFALILAVFLLGLGLGSSQGARLAARTEAPWRLFAWCQILVAAALCYSAVMIAYVIPYTEATWVLKPFVHQNVLVRFPWDFARCVLAILPGPILWGASFPLALAAAGGGTRDPGRLVGGISAANTTGAILGALGTGLLAIGLAGSHRTQQGLVVAAGATALLLIVTAPAPRRWLARIGAGLVAAAATAGFALLTPHVPHGLLAWGRNIADWENGVTYLEVAEGVDSSVAITESMGIRNFHVAGKIEASTDRTDMRLQRMLGHLPALVHENPRKVLIVGCGAGVTSGTFCDYPSVERIVICELEPKVVELSRRWMREANGGVLDDPRTEVIFDDARHFLATTREKFDVITSDPIHPWVRGAATLYTLDYYALVKQHLEPGGVVTQWVPLYQTDAASVKSQIGTFFHAFPRGTLWNSDITDRGYDVALMAQLEPMVIDADRIDAVLAENDQVRAALEEVDLGSAARLLKTYAGRASDLRPWLADAQLNEDVALRLQYLAGLAIDFYDDVQIFETIKRYRSYPETLFVLPPALELDLRTFLKR